MNTSTDDIGAALASVIGNIDSAYQVLIYQQTAQRISMEVKAYLMAVVSHICNVNKIVKDGQKQGQEHLIDIELDSLVCGELFQLSQCVSKSLKRDFVAFEKNIIDKCQKKFNTEGEKISTKYLSDLMSNLKRGLVSLDDQRVCPAKYADFELFLQGIPSKIVFTQIYRLLETIRHTLMLPRHPETLTSAGTSQYRQAAALSSRHA